MTDHAILRRPRRAASRLLLVAFAAALAAGCASTDGDDVAADNSQLGDRLMTAGNYVSAACKQNDLPARKLHADAETFLAAQAFPGNVRQLRNLMERVAILANGDPVPRTEVERLLAAPRKAAAGDPFTACESFEEFKAESERIFLEQKLTENGWNVKRTAERLGMMRSNLYKKIEKYRLK